MFHKFLKYSDIGATHTLSLLQNTCLHTLWRKKLKASVTTTVNQTVRNGFFPLFGSVTSK